MQVHAHTAQVKTPWMSQIFTMHSTGLQIFAVEDNSATDSQERKDSLQRKKNKVLCRLCHPKAVSHARVQRTGTFRSDECSFSYTSNPHLFSWVIVWQGLCILIIFSSTLTIHSRETQGVWIAIESNFSRYFLPDYRYIHQILWATKICQAAVTRWWFLSTPFNSPHTTIHSPNTWL